LFVGLFDSLIKEDSMSDAPVVPAPKGKAGLIAFLLTAFLIFLAIEQVRPPAPVPATAPLEEFSSGRAMELLRVIAQKPHPTGTDENGRVLTFLVNELAALGFDVQVQTATAVRYEQRWRGPATAATVNNIIARLKGTANTRSVMFAAHYDSVPTGPGTSDDGSGVVTLLEMARAIKAGSPLRNDLVLVITDGEELGLLGAKGFVDQNPWIKDVGVVINFEARGACGPSTMFETSENNGRLIEEFAGATSDVVSNSAMYEAYKRLPNDTDLTVFKEARMPGLNFAYTGCWPRYHTMRDDLADISERTLQHNGVQALALARRFGNADLSRPQTASKEYFSLFGHLVYYPESWTGPLTILAILLFLAVVVMGLRKRLLTVRGIFLGFVVWLASTTVAAAVSQWSWIALRRTRLVSLLPYGMPYHGAWLTFGFMALTVAIVAAPYASLRRTRLGDLTVGALAWWAVLAALMALKAPGANFLFLWPLVASTLELGYAFKQKDAEAEEESVLVWTFPAIVGILIFFPLPFLLVSLVSTTALVIISVSTSLVVGILVPMIHIMTAHKRWLLPGAALAAALVCIVTAMAKSGYSARNPRADSMFYALDADLGQGVWASADRAPDAWTSQFISEEITHGNLNQFLPRSASLIEHPAPAAVLLPPQVSAMEDVTMGDERVLRLWIVSPRHARVAWITVLKGQVLDAHVNDKPVPQETSAGPDPKWGLLYTNVPAQGIVLTLDVKANEPLTLRVTDQADGLPQIAGTSIQPRPADVMPSPSVPFDSTTLVSKTYDFGAQPAGKP
jgi:peptidase M28-like protein